MNISVLYSMTPILLYGCELFAAASCSNVSKRKLKVAFKNIVRQKDMTIFLHPMSNSFITWPLMVIYEFTFYYFYRRLCIHGSRNICLIDYAFHYLPKATYCFLPVRYRTLFSKYHFFVHAISLWNRTPYPYLFSKVAISQVEQRLVLLLLLLSLLYCCLNILSFTFLTAAFYVEY